MILVDFLALDIHFLFVGILVTASKSKDNTYNYNTMTAALMTECVKLFAAAIIFLKE
jgi:hypothetical protein